MSTTHAKKALLAWVASTSTAHPITGFLPSCRRLVNAVPELLTPEEAAQGIAGFMFVSQICDNELWEEITIAAGMLETGGVSSYTWDDLKALICEAEALSCL